MNEPTIKYQNGIPVGTIDPDTKKYILYNHLDFKIQVHEGIEDKDSFRIVGFKVEPIS